MNSKLLRIWWFGGLFMFSCVATDESVEKKSYWSSNIYFSELVEKLNKSNSEATKVACLELRCDTIKSSEQKWESVLSPFIEHDISKSAWSGLFEVDTSEKAGQIIVNYVSNSDKIPVKNVELSFSAEGELQAYTSSRREKNPVYASSQKLSYERNRELEIQGYMQVIGGDTTKYHVIYRFEP